MHEFRGEPGCRPEPGDEPPRAGPHPGLFLELAPSGLVGILDRPVLGHIERAGRDLEEGLADGHPVLADEQDTVVGIEREDRDRARVTDDVARAA